MKDIYDLITDYFSEDHDIRVAKNLLQAYESQKSTEGTTSGNKLNQEASEGLGEGSWLVQDNLVYRLSDETSPRNTDEIWVTLIGGNRNRELCAIAAQCIADMLNKKG